MINQKKRHAKRGQLSMFLVLALLILIGGATVYIIENRSSEEDTQAIFTKDASAIPVAFVPISDFVDSCTRAKAEEAMVLLGEHGGYVQAPTLATGFKVNPLALDQTEQTDAVSFPPGSPSAVAYWRYLKSANDCVGVCEFKSKRPELTLGEQSIEKQIAKYVTDNVASCIDSFSSFSAQGFRISNEGKPKAMVKINEDDVAVALEYPFIASLDSSESSFSRFVINVPVDLKDMYDLATHITNLESNYTFFETQAMNLIVAYSGIDRQRLPPLSDMQFKVGSSLSWSKRDVERKVRQLLSSNMQLFQVDSTANFERPIMQTDLGQRLYDAYIIPLHEEDSESFRGISAEFDTLDSWPMYFDLNCNGDICKPSQALGLIPIFGFQSFDFSYDLSFPVIVTLQDPDAFDGKGYTFRFALEANVRNNAPLPVDFSPLQLAELGTISMVCDEAHRTSGDITIRVTDSSRSPVPDAQVFYGILDSTCNIGATDENGVMTAKFPGGTVGGLLTVTSPNHIQKTVEFTPTSAPEDVSLSLEKVFTLPLVVEKKRLSKGEYGYSFDYGSLPLDLNEHGFVTLKRIPKEGELDDTFSASEFGYVDSKPVDAQVQLAAGDYEVEVVLLRDAMHTIPEQEKCVKMLLAKKCYTIPAMKLHGEDFAPQYKAGGFKGNLTIPYSGLSSAQSIALFAITPDLPMTVDELNTFQDTDTHSNTYKFAMEGEFR